MPVRGVVTLSGYGISIRVDRGHLIVEDGIGSARRRARFARVNHGLRRVVVIAADGSLSLAALRWLADQKTSLAMVDRDGTLLFATGPLGPRLARLRRAQGLALHSDVGVAIARELIDSKLAEQLRLCDHAFGRTDVARVIGSLRAELPLANDVSSLRLIESQAALAYWSCWRSLPVQFPKSDLPRVPEHWRIFGARISPLTGSPRLSVNPPNAMLNYLYAVVESEARLAAIALGLDPGLGVMHADADPRDSLACDLMEPVRPLVDAFVLDWLTRQPLRRGWFFEQRNGNCRLMAPFAERLAQTAGTWAQAIAPIAERLAKRLWSTVRQGQGVTRRAATRLTQQNRRTAKGAPPMAVQKPAAPPRLCRDCGVAVPSSEKYCADCWTRRGPERMRAVAAKGRAFAQTKEAQARRVAARRRNAAAERAWKPSDLPAWLTRDVYTEQIRPRLEEFSAAQLAGALRVSTPYAVQIRAGKCHAHPRHWQTLAGLVGISLDDKGRPGSLR
jgi:CRISPR-associated protein Cas1